VSTTFLKNKQYKLPERQCASVYVYSFHIFSLFTDVRGYVAMRDGVVFAQFDSAFLC
jgi:hypothetical protein